MTNQAYRTQKSRRRGQIMIMLTMFLSFSAMLAGLALDMVFAYTVRTKLSTAMDAVALGALRAAASGTDYGEQGTSVINRASLLFNSNFPPQFMLSSSASITQGPTIYGSNIPSGQSSAYENDPSIPAGTREVRVTAEATVPTFFMRVIGKTQVTVRSAAIASRQDSNVMVVLDRSNSLLSASAWDDVQESAKTFIDFFDNTADTVGIASFGSTGFVHLAPAPGFKTGDLHKTTIDNIVAGGATNSAMGLWLAYAELLALNDPAALNVIVFFTDGQPTAWQANFMTDNVGDVQCNGARNMGTVATTFSGGNPRNIWHFYVPYGATAVNVPGCQSIGDWPKIQKVELMYRPEPGTGTCIPSSWTPSHAGKTKTFNFADGPYTTPDCSSWYWFSQSYSDSRGAASMDRARNQAIAVVDKAQSDGNLNAQVYSIGLGVAGLTAHETFLKIVANDPSYTGSYGYDANQPKGEYIFAPTVNELAAAFEKVRSHVVRLTQ